MEGKEPAGTVRVRYENWRGEIRHRLIKPERIWYGKTEWHPDPQWLLAAVDMEDGKVKDFAMSGISEWGVV